MSDIYLSLTETPTVVTLSQPVVSGALSSSVTVTNVVSVNVVTMPAINVTAAAPSVTTVVGTVAVSNFPASSSVTIGGFSTSSLPPSTVTVANSVTINGTVTANANLSNTFQDEYNTLLISGTLTGYLSDALKGVYFESVFGYLKSCWTPDGTRPKIDYDYAPSGEYSGQRWRLYSPELAPGDSSVVFYANSNTEFISAVTGWTVVTLSGYSGAVSSQLYFNLPVALNNTESTPIHIVGSPAVGGYPVLVNGTVTIGSSVTIGSLPAISGTVTANLPTSGAFGGGLQGYNGTNTYLNVGLQNIGGTSLNGASNLPISGTVTVGNSVTIGSLPAISGTVTVGAMPSGSLTTRFGTPTTANVSFATSAVTNANRKYLLIQNVTTGSNVITVGIGFTPTTTQGIQLTAGAGITFESSYIPTGQIFVLSSVTASNFTILEA